MTRVLIWTPNYAPELTGIPPLVTDLAEGLSERVERVDVVAPFPNYPARVIAPAYRHRLWVREAGHGVRITRHWLRVRPSESFLDKVLYEASVGMSALPHVLRSLPAVDVVVCVVPTLLASALAARLPGSHRLVVWVQDLVVPAARSLGVTPLRDRALSIASQLEATAYRRADRVVVCSPGFVPHVLGCGGSPERLHVILNWADTDAIQASPWPKSSTRARFLYAGNIGYTQGLETLLAAARLVANEVDVEIVGLGNARRSLERASRRSTNVTFRDPVPVSDYPYLLSSADACLVIQRAIAEGVNFPSKIATYLAAGRPIVASIGETAPAAEMLRASGGAVLVPPEDPKRLAKEMLRLARDRSLRVKLGNAGRSYAERHLSKDAAVAAFADVILR